MAYELLSSSRSSPRSISKFLFRFSKERTGIDTVIKQTTTHFRNLSDNSGYERGRTYLYWNYIMNSLCARGPLTIFKQALYLSILPSLLILENLWLLVNICVGIILALIWKGDMLQLTLIYAYKQVEQYYLKGEYVWCIDVQNPFDWILAVTPANHT